MSKNHHLEDIKAVRNYVGALTVAMAGLSIHFWGAIAPNIPIKGEDPWHFVALLLGSMLILFGWALVYVVAMLSRESIDEEVDKYIESGKMESQIGAE